MAKQLKDKKHKSSEETIWDLPCKLRETLEPSEYKHVVLGLVLLKFASNKFEEPKRELISQNKNRYLKDNILILLLFELLTQFCIRIIILIYNKLYLGSLYCKKVYLMEFSHF
jgi:type I restriction-modification system DNA methylase subunit